MMGTETVINEVRDRECLWNPNHPGYKNKFEKVLAWQDVCTNVAPNFMNASNAEKRDIVRAVQLRWKTARDAYVKCKSHMKKSTVKNKNKYVFYDALTFLDRVKDSGAEEISEDSSPETPVATEEQVEDPLETEDVPEPPGKRQRLRFIKPKLKTKRKRIMQSFESRLMRTTHNNSNEATVSNSTPSLLQEDDQAFFNSLAPILKDFDSYKKMVFRSRIMEIAMDIGDIRPITKEEPVLYFEERE